MPVENLLLFHAPTRLPDKPIGHNMLVLINRHLWHLVVIVTLALEYLATGFFFGLCVPCFFTMHMSIRYIQYTQVLRHKRQHIRMVTF